MMSACVDPEVFVRGGPTLRDGPILTFLFFS